PSLASRSYALPRALHSFPTRRSSDLVETALREQFQGQSHIPRLGLRLAQQFGVKVLECGGLDQAAVPHIVVVALCCTAVDDGLLDRKSTRLNSSHDSTSYAVFCLKKV